MPDVEIRIESDDTIADIANLADWLRHERELQGRFRAVQRPPGENELGGAVDLLTVALGSGGVGVALAQSLSAWLGTRRSRVRLSLKTPDGRTIEVDAQGVRDADGLIRGFLDAGRDSDRNTHQNTDRDTHGDTDR